MNRFSTLGLSLATLAVTLSAPISLQTLPSGTVTLETAEAVATSSLINVSGQIGPEHERTLSSGRTRRMALHSFWGRRGQSITISLTSQDFNTVVALIDANTNEVIDIQSDLTSNNSTLQITLPTDGPYLVGVTSPSPQPAGNYRLLVTAQN
jgi:hypothetical protein